MFIVVFSDVGDIYMINRLFLENINTIKLLSGNRLCGRRFINTFLTV